MKLRSCGLTSVPRLSASFSISSRCSLVRRLGISHSLTAHPQHLAGLGSTWNLEDRRAIHCWYFHLCTQGCLGNIDIKVEQDIIFPPVEKPMFVYTDTEIQVTTRTPVQARLTFSAQTDPGTGVDTTRDFHCLAA
jgi:hypothetical protein